METPILIENLEKTYKGGFKAVDALSLSVPRRSFVGFLGPNGAGKTTTIKIMTHLLDATGGKVYLNGVDAMSDPKKAMAEVGAVVETPEFYPYLTPVETLEYLGRIRGMSKQDIRRRTDVVLETVKMTEVKNKRVGQFSKGMKQRIAIAQAIMHEPSTIILDEPTSGLDPRGMYEVREVLNDLKKEDYTNAAKAFNLHPRKGSLAIGADADIVVLDPDKTRTLSAKTQRQNTDFSVWEGMEVKGAVVHTLSRGRHVYADGDLRAEAGWGRYVPRKPFGPVYEGRI